MISAAVSIVYGDIKKCILYNANAMMGCWQFSYFESLSVRIEIGTEVAWM